MARWFRFYDEALNDPKVQRLPPALFKQWVNILCVASQQNGHVPDAIRLAFLLRISEDRARNALKTLTAWGLLKPTETGHIPHNWDKRQYKSDRSNDRVRDYRERQRNAQCNVTETPSETDTETEQTVANATGAVAPTGDDLKTQLFGPCLDWLAKQSGKAQGQLRSVIGKWLKDWGDGPVLEAFVSAQRESPIDPVAWITRTLESRHGNRSRTKPTANETARAGLAAGVLGA